MSDDTGEVRGLIRRNGTRIEIQLEREFDHPPETVWDMLTNPVQLALWMAPGVFEAKAGGRIQLDFGASGTPIEGLVQICEPNRLLTYSWSAGNDPERPMRWELSERNGTTHLTLSIQLPDNDLVAISCAGWDAHLEMLMAALEGISISFPAARFRKAREVFAEMAKRVQVA
ncbi:MAG TPA: SRPBCC family protein [Marinobacter sp.]|nr:SRPBCC family protein [Marinobacter sp.]